MSRLIIALGSIFCVGGILALQAQPPAESQSASTYRVRLRYQIDAERQQRYALYKQMLARLQAAGFKAEPGRPGEELYGDQLAGSIPATGVSALRLERFIRTAVLVPSSMQLPADGTVLVRLELTTALGREKQKAVAELARKQLQSLNFVENYGYDNQDHTRLVGRLSAAGLYQLLSESTEVPLSQLLREGVPGKASIIRLAVVLPEPNQPQPDAPLPTAAPAGKEYLDKISADLKSYLVKVPEADLEKLMRVEVVLRGASLSEPLKHELAYPPTHFLTLGSLGPVVSGLTAPTRLTALAASPNVSTIRLPQPARPFALPAQGNIGLFVDFVPLGQDTTPAVRTVSHLHAPATARLVVIGDDFRGYTNLVGSTLPKNTRLVDVTRELRSDLQPHPLADEAGTGQGTQLAAAFHKNHPADELILVRIDSSLPYQTAEVGECVQGLPWNTDAFSMRKAELNAEEERIEVERIEVRVLRRQALDEFGLDDNTRKLRESYRKRQEALDAAEKEYYAKLRRLQQFMTETQSLKGAGQILVALQWTDGYVDRPGSPATLRYLPADLFRGVSWMQAVARRPGQLWNGLFRDRNNDGVMEFSADSRASRNDLAFLAWKSFGISQPQPNLPENAVVEVTLQWTEAHDPNFSKEAKDIYRKPLANLALVVLRQRDPSAKQLPADIFEVAARSPILADRVENDPRYSHYQTTARFVVAAGGGRYALQVTGSSPLSTFPSEVEALTAERPEIRPKITLEVVDPAHRNQGRVVFERIATGE